MAAVKQIHYLAAIPECFELFAYHKNLIFIFDPLAIDPDLGKAAVRKFLRWAAHLSAYNYVCIHVRWKEISGQTYSYDGTLRSLSEA